MLARVLGEQLRPHVLALRRPSMHREICSTILHKEKNRKGLRSNNSRVGAEARTSFTVLTLTYPRPDNKV